MLAIDEMEIGLHGTGLAPGEITFEALEALAHALQLLATRLGRYYAGHEGPGRSSAAVERASCLRLRAVTAGSTVLAVAIGAQDQAVVDANHRVLDGIFDVFTGIARDEPPPWTTPLIGDAAVSLIDALARTSTRCDLRDPTRRHSLVRFHPRSASRLVWAVERLPTPRQADVSVSGRLDLVDLRRSRFRLRDRAGNDISLDDVVNAATAAPLVGELVTATGEATLGSRGQVIGLTEAVVVRTDLPDLTPPTMADIDRVTAPLMGGIAGVTHDEVAEFLAQVRE